MNAKHKVAVLGSGNIGTDLLIKLHRYSKSLEIVALVGIDPNSDGLARARRLGVTAIDDGLEGLRRMPGYADIEVVFDATSASAHQHHAEVLRADGKRVIDLTPAAVGPYVVPVVNLDQHLEKPNVNMVTCGGQATIPIVSAVSQCASVRYAEIVASIASKSAGPGTRANIDEFTETTARALEAVGGAKKGKAIIVLNPAEPPLIMRDTVYCLTEGGDEDAIRASINAMVSRVVDYVPGYRLKQDVQFEKLDAETCAAILREPSAVAGLKVSVFLEIEGAGHYLPVYSGNLDIMTSAAMATGERMVKLAQTREVA